MAIGLVGPRGETPGSGGVKGLGLRGEAVGQAGPRGETPGADGVGDSAELK